jgi:class 3 adenylate cyclase
MEPQIRYARTSDGVNIAYNVSGRGPALVSMPDGPWNHCELMWQPPEGRRWLEALGRRRTVICYDGRGSGLSERDVARFSVETMVLDLEAVVSEVGLDRFAIFAITAAAAPAITYAVSHSQNVSHLMLWHCAARSTEWMTAPQNRALGQLPAADWVLFTETAARFALGFAQDEAAQGVAGVLRACVTPETMLNMYDAIQQFDVAHLLPAITAPTLVLHRRDFRWTPLAAARELAASIPGARLIVFEGSGGAPFVENTEAVVAAIDEFMGLGKGSEPARPGVDAGTAAALVAVILFADVVDSTGLTERLGDAAFRDKARDLDAALRAIIRDSAGTPIEGKLLGDGVLATFTSARQAIEAALACGRAGDEGGLPLHLGLHAGDVIREEGNVFGGAVNVAARISGLSAPGEVLVSDIVRELARTSAGVAFEDAGERLLKGVGEPVRVWTVVEFE